MQVKYTPESQTARHPRFCDCTVRILRPINAVKTIGKNPNAPPAMAKVGKKGKGTLFPIGRFVPP
jgi:hypothetical protein